jgi:hypothetical protein
MNLRKLIFAAEEQVADDGAVEEEGPFDFSGFPQAFPEDGDAASRTEKATWRQQVSFAVSLRMNMTRRFEHAHCIEYIRSTRVHFFF